MKHWRLIALGTTALMAGAFFWHQQREVAAATGAVQSDKMILAGATASPPGATGAKVGAKFTAKQSNANPDSYRSLFDQSRNYWLLANRILAAAKSGNSDAQYYLSRSIEYCREKNGFFFSHRGQQLSLEEGLQYAVKRNLPIEIAREVYDKCHDFTVNDQSVLGDPSDWLAKATASGQSLAESTTAEKMLISSSQEMLSRASGVAKPDPGAPIGAGLNPADLLRSAVESDDPEVFFTIGEMLPLLFSTNTDTTVDRLAWMLLACERGFDCTANADWVKLSCGSTTACASATAPTDVVQSFSGNNWPAVQQRASDMSAKIAAGKWDQLGIGPRIVQSGPN
jgi:hypothetical protein